MMFRFDTQLRVYLHRESVDFRLSVNGLAALVQNALGLNPFAQALYVFRNRRADRIKILLWDRNGYWLLYKRLEQDRFVWPRDESVIALTVEQLHWLLDGINIEAMRRHPDRHYERVG
jgi:transposase